MNENVIIFKKYMLKYHTYNLLLNGSGFNKKIVQMSQNVNNW